MERQAPSDVEAAPLLQQIENYPGSNEEYQAGSLDKCQNDGQDKINFIQYLPLTKAWLFQLTILTAYTLILVLMLGHQYRSLAVFHDSVASTACEYFHSSER